jgi:hypothetical protein
MAVVLAACSGAPSSSGPEFELNAQSPVGSGASAQPAQDDEPDKKPDKETDRETDDDDDDGEGTTTPPPPDPPPPPAQAPSSVRFKGKLSASPAVTYGGSPHCAYRTVLKDIDVLVDFLGDRPVAATVKDIRTEEILKTTVCYHGAAPAARHDFSYALPEKTAADSAPTKFTLDSASYNSPRMTLSMELTKDGDKYNAKLVWKRTGSDAKMSYTVTATVSLGKS